MFQVHVHRTGRNATRSDNGLIVDDGRGYPAWETVWEGRKRAEALAVADEHPIRATVTRIHSGEVLHDNGKEPGDRIRDV